MNLLEHYIRKVIFVEPCTEEWVKEFPDRELLEVTVTYDCYGVIETRTYIWSREQYEDIIEKGYFMA